MIRYSEWTRGALSVDFMAETGRRALALKADLQVAAASPEGPYSVDVHGKSGARLRVTGHDLEETIGEALTRFSAGADATPFQWRAGADGIAHGHDRTPWTLCRQPAVPERFSHPETWRCRRCISALDQHLPQIPELGRLSEETLIAAYGGLPIE